MTSWSDKLDQGRPVIKPSPRTVGDIVEGQIMLVPTARQVDDFIRSIPPGVDVDVRSLRSAMATAQGAEVSCPVYTGYHLRAVAEAAWDDLQRGLPLESITPFWRVLDANTPTTARLACGRDFVLNQRRAEGLAEARG